MECPKCSKEMDAGYLQADKVMAFNKRIHRLSLNPKDKRDVLIVSHVFHASCFSGYICRNCGLVVFDDTNPNAKEIRSKGGEGW